MAEQSCHPAKLLFHAIHSHCSVPAWEYIYVLLGCVLITLAFVELILKVWDVIGKLLLLHVDPFYSTMYLVCMPSCVVCIVCVCNTKGKLSADG